MFNIRCQGLVEPYEIKASLEPALSLSSEVYCLSKLNLNARNYARDLVQGDVVVNGRKKERLLEHLWLCVIIQAA